MVAEAGLRAQRQDYAATRAVVLAAVHRAAQRQTMVRGTSGDPHGAQDISEHDDGAYTATYQGPCCPSWAAVTGCRAFRAAPVQGEEAKGTGEREGQGAALKWGCADRGASARPMERCPAGHQIRHLRSHRWTGNGRPGEEQGGAWSSPRAGLGASAQEKWPPAGRAGGRSRPSVSGFPRFTARCWPRLCVSCMAGRLSRHIAVMRPKTATMVAHGSVGPALDAGEFVRICR